MEEQSLFQVRFTDEGKKYIRKFAAISYSILVLVVLMNVSIFYWSIKAISARSAAGNIYDQMSTGLYFRLMPYIMMVLSLLSLLGNIYYIRFPQELLRCLEANDEPGANKAFAVLFKGAVIFLVWLLLDMVTIIWDLLGQ
jgi:hypothetical protein